MGLLFSNLPQKNKNKKKTKTKKKKKKTLVPVVFTKNLVERYQAILHCCKYG
ncbi:hypothetical protein Hanom_Chr10g00877861 [Helianthus anomalus]